MPLKKKKIIRRKIVNKAIIKSHKTEKKKIQDKSLHNKRTQKRCNENVDSCDKGDAKIITDKRTLAAKKAKMPLQSAYYRCTGLSNKEKSYVICSCQAKMTRYLTLKFLAMNAIKYHKIFTIYGSNNAIRKALIERGWVEKIPVNRMNLAKIKNGHLSREEMQNELERILLSNLVDKYPPNFIWRNKDDGDPISCTDVRKESVLIENRLTKSDPIWTSKQGLCLSMKRNCWFYIEDVSEVCCPRTYNTLDSYEIEDFDQDYKITACTSLLKWVLSMIADGCKVFSKTGNISLKIFLFALNMCKEYLLRKRNRDIDDDLNPVSAQQWNHFLKKYYCIIGNEDIFRLDQENKLPLYLIYARSLLEEMYKYRPQMSCEGCHNIWIIKPAHNSRGRGIRMASKLPVINSLINKQNAKFVIQKYIEEPSLIHDTKFDIRQYYLVTSTFPLEIWMYRDCYLKFSSQNFNLMNFHESIHLTNYAVQRKYTNCEGRHEDLPLNNMWHSDTYKTYLDSIGKGKVWDNLIYPSMKKSIVGIMLSSQDSMVPSKNKFELYGCDFVIDKLYKPWLIEINSGPDLKHTTSVTAKICPAVLSDVIKVVVDYPKNRNCSTGKFECIYRQPMTMPKYGASIDLCVQGYSLPLSYFYKGHLYAKPSNKDDLSRIRNTDSAYTLMKKFKRYHDSTTVFTEMKKSDVADRTKAEDELSVTATILTARAEKFMGKLTSENNKTIKIKPNSRSHSPIGTSSSKSLTDMVNSETEVESSPEPNLPSAKISNISQPDEKYRASVMDDTVRENVNVVTIDTVTRQAETGLDISKNIIQAATTEIDNFIALKQKEYFNQQKN